MIFTALAADEPDPRDFVPVGAFGVYVPADSSAALLDQFSATVTAGFVTPPSTTAEPLTVESLYAAYDLFAGDRPQPREPYRTTAYVGESVPEIEAS